MRLIDAEEVANCYERMMNILDVKNSLPEQITEFAVAREYLQWAFYVINNTPTVDAVEVVRCKDCKYRDKCHKKISIREYDKDIECNYAKFEKLTYCSFGERREEE